MVLSLTCNIQTFDVVGVDMKFHDYHHQVKQVLKAQLDNLASIDFMFL